MKKSLIIILGLACTIHAEESSFTMSVSSDATWTSGVSFNQSASDILSLSYTSTTGSNISTKYYNAITGGTETGEYTNGTYEQDKFTKVNTDFYSPKIQFLNNYEGRYWTLNFSITNGTSSDITLNSLSLTLKGVNADGNTWTNSQYGIGDISLSILDDQETVLGTSTVTIGKDGSSVTGNIEFSNGITLGQKPLKLSLQVKDAANGMTGFVALTGGTFTYKTIPEPATATLSLLALCGLAARRRRK
ncbi:MAG: PEP-CTERM sorting domain-containing protein [Akkermansiaceae bacterium]|nr:PEP-CTERM sorting domain-containing protein [Akkermansiaceae bacterium]